MDLGAILFYAAAAATIAAALGVVVTRSVVYSALLLVLALSLTGLVYLLLLADLLALIQILIYGGTVSVLLLFALMLTPPQTGQSLNNRAWPLAALGALVLLALLVYQALATDWAGLATATGRTLVAAPVRVGPAELGTALFSTWAVPFEIASLVLLVALIGGLFVAGATDREEAEGIVEEVREAAALMVPLEHILVFSAIIFAIGLYGVLARRNAVLVLMAIELMLNAVAINLVAFASRATVPVSAAAGATSTTADPFQFSGLVFAVFVITIAAAELGLGLAIVLRVYRMRSTVNVDELDLMRW